MSTHLPNDPQPLSPHQEALFRQLGEAQQQIDGSVQQKLEQLHKGLMFTRGIVGALFGAAGVVAASTIYVMTLQWTVRDNANLVVWLRAENESRRNEIRTLELQLKDKANRP